tara:strand:+ start:1250 stop:1864 length:615 start_codon:yes stop_codon:yes gene_type:complete
MDNEANLIFTQYLNEAKEAPKGRHYDSAGRLRKGDADSDGRGGPKYRSDPTYVNPNDEEEKPAEEDDMGLGPNTPSMVRVTSIGNTTPYRKGAGAPIRQTSDEEHVYIQAGETDEQEDDCGCEDDCECNQEENDVDYDGELDMARAELLKAADYAVKLFNHIENVDNLEGWTASKITKAADYLSSVFHYMEYEALNASVEDRES